MKKLLLFILLILYSFIFYSQEFSKCNISYKDKGNNILKSVYDASFMLTHSLSQEIIPETSVSCNNNGIQYENSYYRAFDLASSTFNVNGDWSVQEVQVGIGYAKAGIDTIQNIKLVLYVMSEYSGNIPLDSLSQKGDTINFQVSNNESGTIKHINIQPSISIPKGNVLVVEAIVPDGQEDGNVFFIGSNDLPQTDKTFIKAKHCNVDDPVDVSDIGYADMHLLINVVGAYDAANPQILSFSIDGQLVPTILSNNPNLINLILPADTSLIKLTPNIIIPAGFNISPSSGEEVDFSNGDVEYIVSNESNKISESWFVNVSKAQADIIGFTIDNQVGESIIDNVNYTVKAVLPSSADLTNLSPVITLYRDFIVSPESQTNQDFSSGAVIYNVSHITEPISQDWSVSITKDSKFNKVSEIKFYPNPAKDFINIITNDFIKAEIYSISGKHICTLFNKKINISSLEEGLYFIKIYSYNKVITYKIIKEA